MQIRQRSNVRERDEEVKEKIYHEFCGIRNAPKRLPRHGGDGGGKKVSNKSKQGVKFGRKEFSCFCDHRKSDWARWMDGRIDGGRERKRSIANLLVYTARSRACVTARSRKWQKGRIENIPTGASPLLTQISNFFRVQSLLPWPFAFQMYLGTQRIGSSQSRQALADDLVAAN